jgi:chorismate mutase
MQQGMQQGEARVLLRQLQLKFGELPDDVRQRIAAADEQSLLLWSERLLTARDVAEVWQ